MMMMRVAWMIIVLLSASQLSAAVQTKTIEYRHGDTTLQGFLAWDDQVQEKRPGVLVVHEWWGLNDYAQQRARQLAELGYVAFALDMYGEGKVTEHPREASQWASQVRSNVDQWRARAVAGLDVLRQQPQVDPQRIAAIGYCFGGATVLQLAYAGENLRGVVSFHGALPALPEGQGSDIKASILVCHGADDPFVPEEQVQKFRAGLDRAEVDWHMVYFSNAQHSFTNPEADQRDIEGIAYNQKADQRSWQHMQLFFQEVLQD